MHRLVGTPPERKRKPRPAPQPMAPIPEAIYCSAPQIRFAPVPYHSAMHTYPSIGRKLQDTKAGADAQLMTSLNAEARMKGRQKPPTGSAVRPTRSRPQCTQSQLRLHPQLDLCPHLDLRPGPRLCPRSPFLAPKTHERHPSHPGCLPPCHHPGMPCASVQRTPVSV